MECSYPCQGVPVPRGGFLLLPPRAARLRLWTTGNDLLTPHLAAPAPTPTDEACHHPPTALIRVCGYGFAPFAANTVQNRTHYWLWGLGQCRQGRGALPAVVVPSEASAMRRRWTMPEVGGGAILRDVGCGFSFCPE